MTLIYKIPGAELALAQAVWGGEGYYSRDPDTARGRRVTSYSITRRRT